MALAYSAYQSECMGRIHRLAQATGPVQKQHGKSLYAVRDSLADQEGRNTKQHTRVVRQFMQTFAFARLVMQS